MRVGITSLSRLFMLAFVRTRLSLHQRVIWHDDQIPSHVEIGIGAHVAVNLGPLRIEDVLQLVADAFANDKADNCPISATDEHIVDYAEQSSTTRDHLLTDDVRHPRQVLELSQSLFHRRSTHSHCIGSDRIHGGSRNHLPCSAGSDNRFTMHNDKAGDALAVALYNDLLDFPEALRRFHVDNSAPH